jgi:drug/metabolite transporter (DMT)-like permease
MTINNNILRFTSNFLLILTTFFWGITFVVVKEAISSVDVFVFLCQRFALAFVLLLLLSLVLRRPLKLDVIKKGLILGVMLFGGFSLQTLSLVYTSASNTAFLTGLNVVFVPLFSALLFKKKIDFNMIIGVTFAFTGLYLLCAQTQLYLNTGDLLAVLCALCIALHLIYTGRYAGKSDIYWLTTIQIGAIALLSGIIAVVKGEQVFVYYPEIRNALIVCALFATIFAYLVQTTMQKYISPVNTALIFCLEPVFAAMVAYFFIGERLGARGIAGAVLIFMGMFSAEMSFSRIFNFLKEKNETKIL